MTGIFKFYQDLVYFLMRLNIPYMDGMGDISPRHPAIFSNDGVFNQLLGYIKLNHGKDTPLNFPESCRGKMEQLDFFQVNPFTCTKQTLLQISGLSAMEVMCIES